MTGNGGPEGKNPTTEYNMSRRKKRLKRLLNRYEFDNVELEKLYKRYIYKLQQTSIGYMLAVFILLTICLAALNLFYLLYPTIRSIYLLLQCLFFIAVFVFINTRYMEETYFIPLCYVLMLFLVIFATMSFPIPFGDRPPLESQTDFNNKDRGHSNTIYKQHLTNHDHQYNKRNVNPTGNEQSGTEDPSIIKPSFPSGFTSDKAAGKYRVSREDEVVTNVNNDAVAGSTPTPGNNRLVVLQNSYQPDREYLSLPIQGVWEVAFVVFMVYTLMPMQRMISVMLGILLPSGHLIVAGLLSSETTASDSIQLSLWRQVSPPFLFIYFLC